MFILDIRLNTLKDKVDKFIIVEATKNHAGENKSLNFRFENFSKFKDKIIYISVLDKPKNLQPLSEKNEKNDTSSQNRNAEISISTNTSTRHDWDEDVHYRFRWRWVR